MQSQLEHERLIEEMHKLLGVHPLNAPDSELRAALGKADGETKQRYYVLAEQNRIACEKAQKEL